METTHSVEDLGYGATRYARVASTSGEGEAMLMSMWTTHTTGTSMAEPPPPPPPALDPVEVTFSLSEDADDPHFLEADDDDDAETAMAKVNDEIMVASNSDAIITPMFVDGANGVSVSEGDNMPFGRVSWGLLQSKVLSDGATFMVQRAVVGARRAVDGANQETEPSGDVAYVTCGPFECVDGKEKAELSITNSAVCTAWDPMVEFEVGKVDNDVLDATQAQIDANREKRQFDLKKEYDDNDGVDLGIVTSSSLKMNVKHVFSGVAGGTNTSVTVEAASGSDKALTMKGVAKAILVNAEEESLETLYNDTEVCDNAYASEDVSSKIDRPGGPNCFRLLGPGAGRGDNDVSEGADYLSGWSIELSPVDGDVTWGSVEWDDDPFETLTCGDADPIMVADHVDICEMFDAEVDYATGRGWTPEVVFDAANQVVMWSAGATKAKTGEQMFKTIWFDDNLNTVILKDNKAADQADRAIALGAAAPAPSHGLHDLYGDNGAANNIKKIWQLLTDDDGDLNAGDLGKVDLVSSTDDRSTEDDERTILVESCETEDTSYLPRDGYDTDGVVENDDGAGWPPVQNQGPKRNRRGRRSDDWERH